MTKVKDGVLGLSVGVEVWDPGRGCEVHVHVVTGSGSRWSPGERYTGRYGWYEEETTTR